MSEKDPIRVFVTHNFSETNDYLRVFEFLEASDRFFYLNTSKPENAPSSGALDEIKDEWILQIKASEVVVVVASLYAEKPELISYQMDVAEANDKPIIAIRPFGGMQKTSPDLVERARALVEWNDREMVDAIRREARKEDTQRWEVIDFP